MSRADDNPPKEDTVVGLPQTLAAARLGPNVEASLPQVVESVLKATQRVPAQVDEEVGGAPLVAEVLDTHHPHLPGRVGVGWHQPNGERIERWIAVLRGLRIRRGDRVLMSKPANWASWVITGVIEGMDAPEPAAQEAAADAVPDRALALERGEALRITTVDGQPLVEITSEDGGPVVRLLDPSVDLDLPGRLRVRAEVIELEARDGGVDIRTDGEAVVRGRVIRLN